MTTGRLTRQELGWLLAQEARGAAKMLRQDVTLLTQPPPADPEAPPVAVPDLRVETTLNVLDDTIGLLSELESTPATKARRGRIDLAALLMELAPNASVSIEPGAGTEVFGEESELRRMLHVLVSQTNSGQEIAGAPARIRRENESVKISVDLGPDVSASTDLERRWLSRMAVRMGGRLDLEGGTMSVLLPADASADQSEVAGLRKELAQAQQLGEVYARELAAAFGAGALPEVEARSDVREITVRRFDLLVGLASALHRALSPVFRGLNEAAERLDSRDGAALSVPVATGYELVGELGRVAGCPAAESSDAFDMARVLREAAGQAEARAARHEIRFIVDAPAELPWRAPPRATALLLRALIDHAILATPRGGSVQLALACVGDDSRPALRVTDGGPAVPAAAHADLLEHRVDPASLGRPPGLGLLVAHVTAAFVGGSLRLSDDGGRTVVEARF